VSDTTPARPRLRDRRAVALLAELGGGVIVGLLLSRGGGSLGALGGRAVEPSFGDLVGALLGIYSGYVLGVPLGVAGVGHLFKQRGSFWLALLGSILGSILGSLLGGLLRLLLAGQLQPNQALLPLALAFFVAVPAFGLAGFNLRRRSAR
jgi:hypothetical protein